MSEKDYAPLSAACVRALHDKMYDKRKTAAFEIEKMVKEFAAVNNTGQIKRLLKVLGQDFAISTNPHARKGGLLGLAAVAIALGKVKDTSVYTDELIKPILGCLSDQDSRVRYYACESLYNVVKVSRGAVLPHFPSIFTALSKIVTDPEQNVKNASELLDRLLKDIVSESSGFDLEGFIPLLRERMYSVNDKGFNNKNPFVRQFVIAWISVLDMVPDVDLVTYLPEILDGLFKILDDPNQEVKKMCETTLGEFLRGIKADPSRVNFGAMINIVIEHAKEKNDELVQFTAITWIKEFVQLSGPAMLPHMANIFTAILPCLAYDTDARRNIKETATAVNFTLMKLVALQDEFSSEESEELRPSSVDHIDVKLDIPAVVEVLTQNLCHKSIQTKVAVLRWIHHLYVKIPNKMSEHIEVLFPALQRTLSDEADQVVQQCLVVIAEVISKPQTSPSGVDSAGDDNKTKVTRTASQYYYKFVVSLLQSFSNDSRLLDERGSFIIRQLCVLLNAEDIYRTIAEILLKETNLKFARLMVEHLNIILLTSSELYELRNRLKDLKDLESCALFCCLYETWCHNPIATVALCLLSQNYKHTCDLIRFFRNLEVTVDFLTEIDKLVQLIESPIFAFLRLELLEVPCDVNLIRALYGLLMLLPQTEAFQTLRIRLACIPSLHLRCEEVATEVKKLPERMRSIDYEKLLEHFINMQEKHKQYKKSMRAKEISSLETEISNIET